MGDTTSESLISDRRRERIIEGVQTFLSMAFAWCALSWADWHFFRHNMFSRDDVIATFMYICVMNSAGAVVIIFVLEFVARRGRVPDKALQKIIDGAGMIV